MGKLPKLSKLARRKLKVARRMVFDQIGIIAIKPRSKAPDSRFCPRGSHDATQNLDQIKQWLQEDDRIGLAGVMRETQYLVVDVDGPEGAKAAKMLGPLPKTFAVNTRNGTHRYYRHHGKVSGSRIKLATDLDIIASGYVLLPESEHPDGGQYEASDLNRNIVTLPQRTIDAINRERKAKNAITTDDKGETSKIAKGRRNSALASIAGSLRHQGYGSDFLFTALTAINEAHCTPSLPRKEVRQIAESVGRYAAADADLFAEMANVEPRDVEFSWYPYLVRGAVNLLEGDPGTGKTYLLCTVAACFSAGIALPGQDVVRPVNVLFMSAEDDPDTTLVRRLTRMGANLDRITYTTRYFQLEEAALGWIEKHITEKGVELVILDPLLAYMQGGIDMNKANETRPFMARLAELAKRTNVTIIGLRHLTKGSKDKAIYRGLGSIDITAAARSALMLGLHPEDEDVRVMMHIKHNLSERGASLAYELLDGDYRRGKVPKLKWLGEVEIRPEDLAAAPGQAGRPNEARQAAVTFLQQTLAHGPKPVKQVLAMGEKRSHSERTLRRAAKDIGVAKEGGCWKIAKNNL
ncbi:AAA family ATPase [Parasphingorhabdus sp.]|uniref:AAA family ATPase n=1 Tax=Parasphingorhabdus sp. TaxID=2709688 RepID=UPI003D27CFBB